VPGRRSGQTQRFSDSRALDACNKLRDDPTDPYSANRRSFEEQLNTSRERHSGIALAIADLDHFKALNDTYGHANGDRALRLFAQTLASAVRGDDLVCRYGGEEFVVAFLNCTSANAYRALQAFRSRLEAARTTAGLPKFTVSFGLIDVLPAEDLEAEIARADKALFAAKEEGRDQVVVHDR
jgi:diguanylate cyclase (GGDEF)-like protein